MDDARIRRLSAQMLLHERSYAQRRVFEIQHERKQWRSNPSDGGAIHQMSRLAELEQYEAEIHAINSEIGKRKQTGNFNPMPVEREVVAKKNAPMVPNLRPSKAASLEELEGEELPIKVIDRGYPRAWRPEDGPIHDTDPAKTIIDVSQTTNKSSRR